MKKLTVLAGLSGTAGTMRNLVVIAVLSVAFASPSGASGSTDSFAGTCALRGMPSSPAPGELTLAARGECSGLLNGELVRNGGVALEAHTLSLGLTFSGRGSLLFDSRQTAIDFVIDVIGPVLQLAGDDGGNAVVSLRPDPLTDPVFATRWQATAVTVPQIRG